uniref:Uncharacterized protein n=1 Tax=Arcella intermedia TaxID=1963864 RepID=A0A6B2LWG8_9EUKA
MVGNKCDLLNDRCVTTQEAQEFADHVELEFFETSAKTGENVEEAFVRLSTTVLEKLDS